MKEREIIDPNSIVAGTPDWQEGYQQGLLAGYTKSIVLIRHLQRALSSPKTPRWVNQRFTQQEILEEAMELISENINENEMD